MSVFLFKLTSLHNTSLTLKKVRHSYKGTNISIVKQSLQYNEK